MPHRPLLHPCPPLTNSPAQLHRSARLAREVETFVDRFRSIPAFTANLTMELFQKQTQC